MLVLSRKCEQSLLLGDDIVVTVLGIEGDRVKLGIEAPRSVTVLRQEVYQQLRSSNTSAAVRASRPSIHAVAAALRGRSAEPTIATSTTTTTTTTEATEEEQVAV